MRIDRVHDDSVLKQIKALWRTNSSTLGFFPDGAFTEYAGKKQIIGAFDSDGKCIGYLLYRVSGEKAFIVHLCVHESARRKGIARRLVDELFRLTSDMEATCLWCRRDFDASRIWEELGFVALADRPGKNQEGKELTFWKREHERPTLFGSQAGSETYTKLRAALDASVFFDLLDDENSESLSLKADWLSPYLDLYIMDEMFNEINRRKQSLQRKRSRDLARRYRILSPTPELWQAKEKIIRHLYPISISAQDKSDIRHLAKALASDIQFLVTRDGPLLRSADTIYKELGISAVRPSDIVIRLDEFRRETAYQPARFERTLFQARPIRTGEAISLNKFFQCSNQGEGRAQFQEYLGKVLAYPDKFECILIRDADSLPVAIIAYSREIPEQLDVPLLRIKQGNLTSTLARNLAFRVMRLGACETRPIVKITDPFLSQLVSEALRETGYLRTKSGWTKIALPFAGTSQELLGRIRSLDSTLLEFEPSFKTTFEKVLKRSGDTNVFRTAEEAERLFWPAKITDVDIPSYILPIKPHWAQELFDEGLAKQTLFGARPELGLNREGVYYRSPKVSRDLAAHARILWYVSSDKKYQDSMQLRACSYIDSVSVGRPKDLFRQYRRLGVYEWKDLYELADRNVNNNIMAIQFSHTELFSRPVSWQELQQILRHDGSPSQIQSPHRISSKTFLTLYRAGTGR